MLNSLWIKNVALIREVSVSFGKGINVLSGETGSGKSILVDSIGFVLGDRADRGMIRTGEDFAFAEALFDLSDEPSALATAKELGFPDEELLISRKLTESGKNEYRINGRVVTAGVYKELTANLVDIFGQSEHLYLMQPEKHLGVIDAFSDDQTMRASVAQACRRVKELQQELKKYGGSEAERERTLDLMQYQIRELESADLRIGEEKELKEQRLQIVNAEKIAGALQEAVNLLQRGESNALASVGESQSLVSSLSQWSQEYASLADRLQNAYYELSDVGETLRDKLYAVNYDEAALNEIEQRLDVLKALQRKYGATEEDMLRFLAETKEKYLALQNAAEEMEKRTAEILAEKAKWYAFALQLHEARVAAARSFEKQIEEELHDLGMAGATFRVQFAEIPAPENASLSENGIDAAEFMLSANVGEPLKPLVKVISGGEMSRFMLAIKNITAQLEEIPTMIFDEIDTGISGRMAQTVAIKLASVSRSYQSIVVTHLPQIAAMGDRNFKIAKHVADGHTYTSVEELSEEAKIEEVSRLMGGDNIGEFGGLHAREYVLWAKEQKQKLAR